MRYVRPKDVKKMLVQQARSTYWKKWAAKHEYEELMEGIRLEPALALEENKGRVDIGLSDESKCQACHWRKAQKSTGFTIAQNGTRSDGRSQRPSESGSKKRELQRRSESGKKVLLCILSVKAHGTGATSVRESGSLRNTSTGVCQQKVSKATLPLTALF